MLYQLSYFRNYVYIKNLQTNKDSTHLKLRLSKPVCILLFQHICGQRWIRTTEVERQQIYSLPHLATLEFALTLSLFQKTHLRQLHNELRFLFLSLLSDSNQRPRDYKSRALAN